MVYDTARSRIVMFGGTDQSTVFADTWAYDGTTWTNLAPATSPPGRSHHGMVYDESRDRVVLFGGCTSANCASSPTDETWEFDGVTWEQITAAAPDARYRPNMAYDPVNAVTVMFGGQISTGALGDTAHYDGTAWTTITTGETPEPAAGAAFVHLAPIRLNVIFGGTGALADQTWTHGYE